MKTIAKVCQNRKSHQPVVRSLCWPDAKLIPPPGDRSLKRTIVLQATGRRERPWECCRGGGQGLTPADQLTPTLPLYTTGHGNACGRPIAL